jgi:DNA-binding NtrC family response regulator
VQSDPAPRIFVVDDEHVIASTLAAILNMNGFSAEFFTRPLEALAASQADIPDLLISDVAMPGLSGIDLAIQMRAQYPKCKILLFSGQAATLDLLEDARIQGHDFHLLQKPVHPSEMLATIGTLATEHGLDTSRTTENPACASQREASTKTVVTNTTEEAMHPNLESMSESMEAAFGAILGGTRARAI